MLNCSSEFCRSAWFYFFPFRLSSFLPQQANIRVHVTSL